MSTADDGAPLAEPSGRRRTPFGPPWLFWLTTIIVGVGTAILAIFVAFELSDRAPTEPDLLTPIDEDSGDVSAFPVPGTQVVSPESQVSIRGPGAVALTADDFSIRGSETDEHSGTMLAHSDGAGISFVPDVAFEPGEEVVISVAGVQVRGSTDGRWTWRVADALPDAATEEPTNGEAEAADEVSRYISAPDIQPPLVSVTPDSPPDYPGFVALGIKNGVVQKGPMLVDDDGQTVWFAPMDANDARDVTRATLGGEPVLTWWEGQVGPGYGYGEAVVVDQSYTEIARFTGGNGYSVDIHELLVKDDGTAWLAAYAPVRMNLSDLDGPRDGVAVDNIVQRVDIATGAVLFEWHGIGDVALTESYLPMEDDQDGETSDTGYDYLHVNSIDINEAGDVLVSARHSCTVYRIDGTTGSTQWRLGGQESDFDVPDDAHFLKQHDARWAGDGTITLFDNGGTCGDTTRESSRGLVLNVDEDAHTVSMIREYVHPDEIWAKSQGSFQELDGGDVLLGWGSLPRWTRMSADGDVLIDSTVPKDLTVGSYRARQVEWNATPTTSPAAAIDSSQDSTTVYASWNGATDVASWRVSDGTTSTDADRTGFETTISVDDTLDIETLSVEAIDSDGNVIGRAETIADVS